MVHPSSRVSPTHRMDSRNYRATPVLRGAIYQTCCRPFWKMDKLCSWMNKILTRRVQIFTIGQYCPEWSLSCSIHWLPEYVWLDSLYCSAPGTGPARYRPPAGSGPYEVMGALFLQPKITAKTLIFQVWISSSIPLKSVYRRLLMVKFLFFSRGSL
jgi:hypothetical protein